MARPLTLPELLKQTELNQLYNQSPFLITVTTKTSLERTLHLLTQYHLHSIPVRDVERNSWPAFVTVHQLLIYALSLTYKVPTDASTPSSTTSTSSTSSQPPATPTPSTTTTTTTPMDPMQQPQSPRSRSSLYEWLQEVYNLQKVSEVFKRTMVGEVLSLSEKINAVANTISVDDALIALTQTPLHIHRIVAFNKLGQMEAVVSQSALLEFLVKNIARLPLSIGTRRISEVGLVRKNLYFLVLKAKLPAIESFWRMYTEGLDCGAIVDGEGRLIGNISSSDLSSVAALDFNTLRHGTYDYVCQYGRRRNVKSRDYFFDLIGEDQNEHQREQDKQRLVPPIAVRSHASVENVMMKMYVCRIHKMWIVDDAFRPISLISLTDVLKFLQLALRENN